jgi:hypothetical protein
VTSGLRTSIQNDISNANSVITTAINAINKVNPFGKINPPQITVPSLDALQNVTLPASFEQALTSLNNTLPTFNDLKQKIESVYVSLAFFSPSTVANFSTASILHLNS